MEALTAEAISKTFGKPVFSDVSLSLQKGEFVSIVGRSGCGKTTLLEVLAGLQAPTHGAVRYADNTKPPVLVFQEFNRSIFPWLTVEGNMDFMTRRYYPANEFKQATRTYLDIVGLDTHRAKYPSQLSGGMKQRLGFARALSIKPDTFF
ncbi:MAG: ABC transporter ATP-binding protein [Flavobacteriales bacterium]|nr:ABC transporter ATP-binding protein [Flavobacteriales bacterium]